MSPSWPSFGLVFLLQHASFLSLTKHTHILPAWSVSACSWEQQDQMNIAHLTSQACAVLSLLSFCLYQEEQTSAHKPKLFIHLHIIRTALHNYSIDAGRTDLLDQLVSNCPIQAAYVGTDLVLLMMGSCDS